MTGDSSDGPGKAIANKSNQINKKVEETRNQARERQAGIRLFRNSTKLSQADHEDRIMPKNADRCNGHNNPMEEI